MIMIINYEMLKILQFVIIRKRVMTLVLYKLYVFYI